MRAATAAIPATATSRFRTRPSVLPLALKTLLRRARISHSQHTLVGQVHQRSRSGQPLVRGEEANIEDPVSEEWILRVYGTDQERKADQPLDFTRETLTPGGRGYRLLDLFRGRCGLIRRLNDVENLQGVRIKGRLNGGTGCVVPNHMHYRAPLVGLRLAPQRGTDLDEAALLQPLVPLVGEGALPDCLASLGQRIGHRVAGKGGDLVGNS